MSDSAYVRVDLGQLARAVGGCEVHSVGVDGDERLES